MKLQVVEERPLRNAASQTLNGILLPVTFVRSARARRTSLRVDAARRRIVLTVPLRMARGTALPPMTTRFSVVGARPFLASQSRYMVQMVGTPPVKVTPSPSISWCRLAPSILSAGSTSLAPTIAAT